MSSHRFKIIGGCVLVISLIVILGSCDMGGEDYADENININQFELDVTDNSGELKFDIVAQSDEDIMSIEVESSEEELSRDFSGEKTAEFSGIIDAYPGTDEKVNVEEINASILAETGAKKRASKEHYVRKYDVLQDTRDDVDIGMFYWPFMEIHWEENSVGEPIIGEWSLAPEKFEHNIVNRHIDQMQSSGVSNVGFLFGQETQDIERYQHIFEVELLDEVGVMIDYDIEKVIKRELDVESHIEFFRNEFFDLKNYKTIDGRPVVFFWGIPALYHSDYHREKVENEWGGTVELFEYLRNQLSHNGRKPYFVGDFQNVGYGYESYGGIDDEAVKLLKKFDAVTTWTGLQLPEETIEWNEQIDFVEENFSGYLALSAKYDFEFIPRAFPGFDDRGNKGWGQNRLTSPDPNYFRKVLDLADKYRTTTHINIASWSEWCEGHMVEPGYFHDYEAYPAYDEAYYGFDFLDEIEDFLQ